MSPKTTIDTIEKLFIEELKVLYSAENQIVKSLPKVAKAAVSRELREALEIHLNETRNQRERLNRIFGILDENPKGKTCEGMRGLLEEGSKTFKEMAQGEVRDAAIISTVQRVEHYEIATYGAVRALAQLLGRHEAARLLDETLAEEKAADRRLTGIAKTINTRVQAA